jgi:hypothetical protein
MSALGRVRTTVAVGLREYVRTPLLLALLAFVPAYFVAVVVRLVPEGRTPVDVAGGPTTVPLADALAATMTPIAVALVAGIAGLFAMHGARDADGRLAVAGFRARELVVGRLVLLAGVAAAATLVATGVTVVSFRPDYLAWFLAGVGLVALTYGAVGVLAGVVLDRLPGVYLLLFGPTLDGLLFQNPSVLDPHPVAGLLPAHFGAEVAVGAAFGSGGNPEALALGLAYLAGVVALASLALYRTLGVE